MATAFNPLRVTRPGLPMLLTMVTALCTVPAANAAANGCRATATAMPTVVELYTSEGCSSCPPADRWVSTLKGRSDVITLAFHVNYWDRLGWPDRFASAEATDRQYRLAQAAGQRGVYTPQVVVNGQDWRRWPGLPIGNVARVATAAASTAALPLELLREGSMVEARLPSGTPRRLSGYWAVVEDGHATRVRSGENAGETLRHDHVVRLYQPVAAFDGGQAQRWTLPVSAGEAAYPRSVVFVVSDALTMQPVQALALRLQANC